MDLKHLQTSFCCYHNLVLLLEEHQGHFKRAFVVGYLPTTQEYQVLRINEQSNTLSGLGEVLVLMGTFKDYQSAKASIEAKMDRSSRSRKIYTPGLLGFARFLQGYYLLYLTDASVVGNLAGHKIYQIRSVRIVRLFIPSKDTTEEAESRHHKLLEEYDFEDNVYFSLTYDLSQTVANNLLENSAQPYRPLQWNHHIRAEAVSLVGERWMLSTVHGYFGQLSRVCWELNTFDVLLIARRSRLHCGTRYIKRGIDPEGNAANYVETEQIVVCTSNDKLSVSSFIQVRGSAPVYWLQRPSLMTSKPQIEIVYSDKDNLGTQSHFTQMITRYGLPILCLNLMRSIQKKPRETILSKHYEKVIRELDSPGVHYIEFDMKNNLKHNGSFREQSEMLAYNAVLSTGMFVVKEYGDQQLLQLQNGVVRANCVDCIDRTNSFQEIIAMTALRLQLRLLIDRPHEFPVFPVSPQIELLLTELYEELGNSVAMQYGGSLAHKKKEGDHDSKLVESLKRHLNNNWSDYKRQELMDVFLGHFQTLPPYVFDSKPQIAHKPSARVEALVRRGWWEQAYRTYLQQLDALKPNSRNELKVFLCKFHLEEFRTRLLSSSKQPLNELLLRFPQPEILKFVLPAPKKTKALHIVPLTENNFSNLAGFRTPTKQSVPIYQSVELESFKLTK